MAKNNLTLFLFVASLQTLQTLYLKHTRVSDVGLRELKPLKNLRSLNLFETNVSEAGLKELQYALPKCRINLYLYWFSLNWKIASLALAGE